MDDAQRVIVRIRLEKCDQDLKYARLLLAEGAYRIAISRAYYAIFVLTTAVLLTLDISRSKHSGVIGAFNQFLVKPGLIEDEYGKILVRAFKARTEADYSDSTEFTREKAQQAIKDAERFAERLKIFLKEAGAI
jgi:uncharacterized protein (UPF0332 family)